MAAQALYGAWLEVAAVGLVAGVASVRRLARLGSREAWRAARPTALKGRAACLAATCAAPDACWAHVLRAKLLQPVERASVPYREAGAAPSSSRVVFAQRLRIARVTALALAGAVSLAAFAVAANGTEGFRAAAVLAAAAATSTAWLAIRAALRATETMRDALAVAAEGPSTVTMPTASIVRGSQTIGHAGSGGCVLCMLGLPGLVLLLAELSSTTEPFTAARARGPVVGFALLATLLAAMGAVARRVSLRIDDGQLVVVAKSFVFVPSRCVVPIEIVRSVRLVERRAGRGREWDIVADLEPEGRTTLLTWSDEKDARRLHASVRAALSLAPIRVERYAPNR
jgi:hypothetical protein